MVVLAVLAAGYFMRRAGGASTFFRSRDAIVGAFFGGAQLPGSLYYKIADQSTAALELTLLQVPILVVLVAWVLMGRTGRRRLAASLSPAGRMLLLVAVSAAVVLNVIVNNPIYNARFWTGTVLISLILAARPLVTPGFTRVFVVGVLFGALVIFPSADVFRHNTASTAPRVPVSQEFLRDVDFDLYQEHLRAVTYVDEHGHTDGRQLLGAALFWLPRSAWPGKPTATGSMVAEAVGQPGLVASSLWTEAYVDFGPAGVVVAFLLLGAGAGVLDRRYRLSVKRSQPGAASLAVVLLAGYEFFLLRGSLLPAVGRLAVLLLLAAAFRTKRATGVDVPEPRTARSAAPRSYQGTSL